MERKELIELAEQLIKNGCSEALENALIAEYPELAKTEDEKKLDHLYTWMRGWEINNEYVEEVYQWIKGLLSSHTASGWIPSDEQMRALNHARVSAQIDDFAILDSLYSDLSKLTEEN